MKNRAQSGWYRWAVLGLLAAWAVEMAPSLAAQRIQTQKPRYHWYKLTERDGVQVYAKDHQDRSLPALRGVGVVEASVQDILAVLFDVSRNCEWVERCAESRVLKTIGETRRVVYSRSTAPWPVSDRDVIVRTSVQYDATTGNVRSGFKSVRSFPGAEPVDGVVRMPRLTGYYLLVPLGDARTRLTFEVDADPGGALPAFLVKWASRSLPVDQINGLRRQVKRLRADARERVANWRLWADPAAADTPAAAP